MSHPPQNSPYTLEPATLNWLDDNPGSSDYGDIYFSCKDGLEETDYVFLQHNHLVERFKALHGQAPGSFTIAETGFGTGLNFLAACNLWQQHAPKDWQLHFISVEKHPLTKSDLQRALKRWPQLQALTHLLIGNYPELTPGLHRVHLMGTSIHLSLWLGDAIEGFQQCLDTSHKQHVARAGAKVDAWFLDGFTPARNPEMWTEALFSVMAQLSKPGTSFATFTAAGDVRRGLQKLGFEVKKAPGFGTKREMIYGLYAPLTENSTQAAATQNPTKSTRRKGMQAPWSVPPHIERPEHVMVIGGGLAGTSSARALANRGVAVTLVERHPRLAQEASGNAQGMLYTKLSPQDGLLNQFTLSSFLYAQRHYKDLQQEGLLSGSQIDLCGLLQLACSDKEQKLLEQLKTAFEGHDSWVQFLSAEQASACAGVESQYPGYHLPQSGWIAPAALCETLCQHPLITTVTHTEALRLHKTDTHWQLQHQVGSFEADAVIIANSHDAKQFEQTAALPLKVIRGQITALDADLFAQQPKTVICHEGYLTPAIDNTLRFGATFDNGDNDKAIRTHDHRRNLDSLHRSLPGLFKGSVDDLMQSQPEGRANLRCTSPDYMPLVGPVHQHDAFLKDFGPLSKDASRDIPQAGQYIEGLYVNIGHGARGLTSTPICAELLASLLCHEPRPLPQNLVQALTPARFLIRDIIRGKIAV